MEGIFNLFAKGYEANGARNGVTISVEGDSIELYKVEDDDFVGYNRVYVDDSEGKERRIVQVGRYKGFLGITRFFVKIFDDKGNRIAQTGKNTFHLLGSEIPYVASCRTEMKSELKEALREVTGQSFTINRKSYYKCSPSIVRRRSSRRLK